MSLRRSCAWLAAAAIIVVLAACAGEREKLAPKSASIPAGINLSGRWRLVGEDALAKRRSTPDVLVAVFLETGSELKVTQTTDGLFISFDRSVVEEYRFGELREVSVGPVTADRASGWDGGRYVIETLDEDGVKLLETYRLEDDGTSLLRTITILRKEARELDVRQVFERS